MSVGDHQGSGDATSADSTSAGSASAGSTSAGSASAGSTSAGDTSAGDTSAGSTSAGSTSAGLHTIGLYSVLSGLPHLAPLPFVDDWARDYLRRRLLRELAAARGAVLPDEALHRLTGDGNELSLRGCVTGCLSAAALKSALYAIKVIARSAFRKLLFFLAIKDTADTAAETWQLGYLLRHALARGDLDSPHPDQVAQVRRAIESTREEVDTRVLEGHLLRTLRGSPRRIWQAARRLGGHLLPFRRQASQKRRAAAEHDPFPLDEEEALLGDVVDRLNRSVTTDSAYLERLERVYVRHLGGAPPVR